MHTILKDRKLQKTIRKSEIKDIPQMLEIFQAAKRKMLPPSAPLVNLQIITVRTRAVIPNLPIIKFS